MLYHKISMAFWKKILNEALLHNKNDNVTSEAIMYFTWICLSASRRGTELYSICKQSTISQKWEEMSVVMK